MGTICAPAYANIFMAEFEKIYLYFLIKNKSIWKIAERFYELIQLKAFFYKVLLQILLQACRVSSQYSLYTSTKNKRQTTLF